MCRFGIYIYIYNWPTLTPKYLSPLCCTILDFQIRRMSKFSSLLCFFVVGFGFISTISGSGQKLGIYEIKKGDDFCLKVTDLGARIISVVLPDKNGTFFFFFFSFPIEFAVTDSCSWILVVIIFLCFLIHRNIRRYCSWFRFSYDLHGEFLFSCGNCIINYLLVSIQSGLGVKRPAMFGISRFLYWLIPTDVDKGLEFHDLFTLRILVKVASCSIS